jgi:hypothetical protein
VVLVLIVAAFGACGRSHRAVKGRAGRPTTTTSTASGTTTTDGAPGVTAAAASTVPSTSGGPGPATPGQATTAPPAPTGTGAIAGHVYRECGAPGSGGACQSQGGVSGDTILVKTGDTTVTSTQTDSDGAYRLEVAAGLYGLEETRNGQATRVQVEAGRTVVVNFTVR